MGDPLSSRSLDSFVRHLAQLEKNAAVPSGLLRAGLRGALRAPRSMGKGLWEGIKSIPSGISTTLERAAHPIKSMPKGWAELAGVQKGEGIPKALRFVRGEGATPQIAKRLGRGGWTGEGRATKYLPVGMKGLTVGGTAAFAAPEIMAAAKREPSPTGERGLLETGLGEAAGLAGMIAGGRRFIPSMGLYMLGSKAGGSLGRVIDRMRGGAGLGTAVSAPSPEEASEQLQNIQRYYR